MWYIVVGDMMKKLLILLLFTATVSASENPIYDQIRKNRKKVSKSYAMRLSNIIHHASLKYKIPARTYTAILMQESTYRLNVVAEGDYGIAQINIKTHAKYDKDKLLIDLKYSVYAGAEVLSWFHKTYAKDDVDWYTRYNCGTATTTKRKTCQKYKKLVSKFLQL